MKAIHDNPLLQESGTLQTGGIDAPTRLMTFAAMVT
jgi:hypothetical protein